MQITVSCSLKSVDKAAQQTFVLSLCTKKTSRHIGGFNRQTPCIWLWLCANNKHYTSPHSTAD